MGPATLAAQQENTRRFMFGTFLMNKKICSTLAPDAPYAPEFEYGWMLPEKNILAMVLAQPKARIHGGSEQMGV